jgi:hypothetical protein
MDSMAKAHPPAMTETVVRDAKTGRLVTLRGAGALKGLPLRKGIDLTKPIAAQVLKGSKRRKGGSAPAKD